MRTASSMAFLESPDSSISSSTVTALRSSSFRAFAASATLLTLSAIFRSLFSSAALAAMQSSMASIIILASIPCASSACSSAPSMVTPRESATLPSPIRSSRLTPCPVYSLAIWGTSGSISSVSRLMASASPAMAERVIASRSPSVALGIARSVSR